MLGAGDHGPTKIREALGAGAGVSCGIAGRLEEVPDILEDPQVLACFLDLGSGGEVLRTGWQAALPEMSAFDAKATVRWGEKSFDDKILKTWPSELQAGGRLQHLGTRTLAEAKRLAELFWRSGSVSRPREQLALQIRLASFDHVPCSRLHWDDVPLRLVCTLAGAGTQVLPESRADREAFAMLESMPIERQGSMSSEEWNNRIVSSSARSWIPAGWKQALVQTPTGWAVLLKGSTWESDAAEGAGTPHPGALHRSPEKASQRVLLQVDFADSVMK